MFYKNTSCSVKTFYGVTFQPGEVKEVPGYINHGQMVVAEKPASKQSKPSSDKMKKISDKSSIIHEDHSGELTEDKNNNNET